MRDRETLVFLQVDFDGLTESWCEICTVFLSCLMVRVKTVRWEVGVKKGSFSFDAFAGSRALFWLSCSFLVSHSYLIPPPLTFCDSIYFDPSLVLSTCLLKQQSVSQACMILFIFFIYVRTSRFEFLLWDPNSYTLIECLNL